MALREIEERRRKRDWTLGLAFLACVIVLWVLSSVILNDLFESGEYSKPFAITWLNTSSFALYLIPYWWSRKHQKSIEDSFKGANDEELSLVTTPEENQIILPSISQQSEINDKLPPLTLKETIQIALWFSILWFLPNFFNNASLIFTSVSSQTVLASTSSFFTIIVGWLFHVEILDFTKVLSICVSFVGVLCVTFNDNPQTNDNLSFQSILTGDVLALLGALFYGIFSIVLKYKVKEDSRVDMKLFFGFVGVFNIVIFWPSIVIADHFGFETFELPPNGKIWSVIIFNCFISFLADFLWARAMLLTSPLTVTVGLCLTIPVAMVFDIVFKFKLNSPVYFLGAVLVCLSFYFINKNEKEDSEHLD